MQFFKWRADDGLASVYPKWCPGILSRVKLLHFYDSNSYLAKKYCKLYLKELVSS